MTPQFKEMWDVLIKAWYSFSKHHPELYLGAALRERMLFKLHSQSVAIEYPAMEWAPLNFCVLG